MASSSHPATQRATGTFISPRYPPTSSDETNDASYRTEANSENATVVLVGDDDGSGDCRSMARHVSASGFGTELGARTASSPPVVGSSDEGGRWVDGRNDGRTLGILDAGGALVAALVVGILVGGSGPREGVDDGSNGVGVEGRGGRDGASSSAGGFGSTTEDPSSGVGPVPSVGEGVGMLPPGTLSVGRGGTSALGDGGVGDDASPSVGVRITNGALPPPGELSVGKGGAALGGGVVGGVVGDDDG